MKKIIIILAGVFIVFIVTMMIISKMFYPDNIAETAPDGGEKDLKTRFYKTDLVNAAKIVAATVPTLSSWGSSWKLVDSKIESDSASVKAEVPVVFFTDDLEVKLTKTANESEVRVDVHSNSRVGKSDFGENRRHVVKILDALDRKFNN